MSIMQMKGVVDLVVEEAMAKEDQIAMEEVEVLCVFQINITHSNSTDQNPFDDSMFLQISIGNVKGTMIVMDATTREETQIMRLGETLIMT